MRELCVKNIEFCAGVAASYKATGQNPGSDREIFPEFTTDRPASHTLTHLTQPIIICAYVYLYLGLEPPNIYIRSSRYFHFSL